MPIFPSADWVAAAKIAALQDPAILKALSEWKDGAFIIVIEEDDGLDEDFCIFINPDKGVLKEVSVISSPLDREARFRISAPYQVIKKLLKGKADPLKLAQDGTIRIKGEKSVLIDKAKGLLGSVNKKSTVETKFIDE